ncbi:MAG: 5-methyltetrahydropteroyltriglutamate--homocysteine S-methyltransferase [Cycloclasticus sp.]|nr:5-methyltetrahydropteroyltriglutamate--homocysteine S-methyltransferase [Cycloclasticus sp.]
MIKTHSLGFPRIGENRELKKILEAFWSAKITETMLLESANKLRVDHWQAQADSGLDLITVGDFSLYDQVLDTSAMLGCIPERFEHHEKNVSLETYFRMARGCSATGEDVSACEMTKWFDTNYHYIVPEFIEHQTFKLSSDKLFDEVEEALLKGYCVKPVILGPLTYLWLGQVKGGFFNKLNLLDNLLKTYEDILNRLSDLGLEWVQIDEPILVLDLPAEWKAAFERAYNKIQRGDLKLLLTTYFGDLSDNLRLACDLPVSGLHIDLIRGPNQLEKVLDWLPQYKVLSLGIIDGRNIWKSDLDKLLSLVKSVSDRTSSTVWLAPSCSLLHVPFSLKREQKLSKNIQQWLAFSLEKLAEINLLKTALQDERITEQEPFRLNRLATKTREESMLIHNEQVQKRLIDEADLNLQRPLDFAARRPLQQKELDLPLLPTTTIGSFPQTVGIRHFRQRYKIGEISTETYTLGMQQAVASDVKKQEALGLDVLVHGEAERNDMVEYFGEQLDGVTFSQYGWVQSYGSRCVKPPIIYGDVSRSKPMTVGWAGYAQSLTEKPMKGMLTGPVTILNWSFVRDDQDRALTCRQIAFAIRDEVLDLEQAGIKIIQIDEAALREGLPLKKREWEKYLEWAIDAFRLVSSGVQDKTQIHTHMCYSNFNDIMQAIKNMDADVITIETARSDMKLLNAFEAFNYPNEIGPGVYDIHSPNVPSVEQMVQLIKLAAKHIPLENLWVNPDCGLKTRSWKEVELALANMVSAANELRLWASSGDSHVS